MDREKLKRERLKRAQELANEVKSGEYIRPFDKQESWFPKRPTIKKDSNALKFDLGRKKGTPSKVVEVEFGSKTPPQNANYHVRDVWEGPNVSSHATLEEAQRWLKTHPDSSCRRVIINRWCEVVFLEEGE